MRIYPGARLQFGAGWQRLRDGEKGAVDVLVKTQCKQGGITGLCVGAENARRYFPKNETTVELLLDHLEIACGLEPEFWEGQAEIYDPRLCAWLELKNPKRLPGRKEMPLAMIPAGKNAFRLQLIGQGRP